jgi:hypothetical protein
VLRATRSGAASGASESRGDAAVESGGEGRFGAEVHRIARCGRERLRGYWPVAAWIGARMLDSEVGWWLPCETRGETCETCMLTRSRVRLARQCAAMGHVHVHAPMRSDQASREQAGGYLRHRQRMQKS